MTENRKTNLILSDRKAKVGVGGLTGPIPFLSDFSASTCNPQPSTGTGEAHSQKSPLHIHFFLCHPNKTGP